MDCANCPHDVTRHKGLDRKVRLESHCTGSLMMGNQKVRCPCTDWEPKPKEEYVPWGKPE